MKLKLYIIVDKLGNKHLVVSDKPETAQWMFCQSHGPASFSSIEDVNPRGVFGTPKGPKTVDQILKDQPYPRILPFIVK